MLDKLASGVEGAASHQQQGVAPSAGGSAEARSVWPARAGHHVMDFWTAICVCHNLIVEGDSSDGDGDSRCAACDSGSLTIHPCSIPRHLCESRGVVYIVELNVFADCLPSSWKSNEVEAARHSFSAPSDPRSG